MNMFISYAQNFEDVILWRALREVDNGFYIDAGAWSPDLDSVTRAFYERGWHGINLEPNPVSHLELSRRRPKDINLPFALGDKPGSLDLHIVGETGLTTARASYAKEYGKRGHPVHIESCSVLTLNIVWDEYVQGRDVHFLKVDVEGLEEEVLRGNDWSRHRPWIVLIEAMLPNTQIAAHEMWESILLHAGYRFVYTDGLNRFYLAEEHADLLPAFAFPPNVFDGFKLAAHAKAEARVADLNKLLEEATERGHSLEQQIAALHASVSWRATAPLRAVSRAVRTLPASVRLVPSISRTIRIMLAFIRLVPSAALLGLLGWLNKRGLLPRLHVWGKKHLPRLHGWFHRRFAHRILHPQASAGLMDDVLSAARFDAEQLPADNHAALEALVSHYLHKREQSGI